MSIFTRSILSPHWLVATILLVLLVAANIGCQLFSDNFQTRLDEPQRLVIRSILYAFAIILFPFTSLLRHILLRLNQTMIGDKPAEDRYLGTVIVCLLLMEVVGIFGVVMFVLGDDSRTLNLLNALGVLGLFLHRPKLTEYKSIVSALSAKNFLIKPSS